MSEPIAEAFEAIVKLAERSGAPVPLSKLDGCWERQVDGHWWIALNGHSEARKCSHGHEIAPYHCYVEFNGWPAGMLQPFGGCIAAGAAANEDAFIAAVNAASPLPAPPELD